MADVMGRPFSFFLYWLVRDVAGSPVGVSFLKNGMMLYYLLCRIIVNNKEYYDDNGTLLRLESDV